MKTPQHTPEPWRWELNEKSKEVQLVGGHPKFDKLVMDFARWGMGGATPRFNREIGALNIMAPARVFDMIVEGREHHAAWFKTIDHPDANRIVSCVNNCAGINPEAVPLMLAALDSPLLNQLFGMIEDSGSSESDKYWPIAQAWQSLRDEALRKATEPTDKQEV